MREPIVPQIITQADTYETPTKVFLFIALKNQMNEWNKYNIKY